MEPSALVSNNSQLALPRVRRYVSYTILKGISLRLRAARGKGIFLCLGSVWLCARQIRELTGIRVSKHAKPAKAVRSNPVLVKCRIFVILHHRHHARIFTWTVRGCTIIAIIPQIARIYAVFRAWDGKRRGTQVRRSDSLRQGDLLWLRWAGLSEAFARQIPPCRPAGVDTLSIGPGGPTRRRSAGRIRNRFFGSVPTSYRISI